MKELADRFYDAFSRLDAATMASCYHPEIQFHDPVFGALNGKDASDMWRMLCTSQSGMDFQLRWEVVNTGSDWAEVDWEAEYTFSPTGRRVHNHIHARLKAVDGKVIEHRDTFSVYRWSKQAMGLSGWLIGWTGYFRRQLQARSRKLLRRFQEKQSK